MADVFVPERRTALLVPLEQPGSAYTGPLYRFTIWASIAALASVAIGIARAAIDELLNLATRKKPSYEIKPLSDRSTVQMVIGQAAATLGAGRAYLYEALDEVWHEALQGTRSTCRARSRFSSPRPTRRSLPRKQSIRFMPRRARRASETNTHSSAIFREVHTMTQHGYISASRYESVGQLLLGVPVEWPFFTL